MEFNMNFKKTLLFLLTFCIIITNNINAYAKSNSNTNSNIVFEKGNYTTIEHLMKNSLKTDNSQKNKKSSLNYDEDIIYTYYDKGIKYKVYSTINNDLTKSCSKIYQLDSKNNETLINTETVIQSGTIIKTITKKNDKENIQYIDLTEFKNTPSLPTDTLARATLNGLPVSSKYKHYSTFKRSKSITAGTVAGVSVIIKGIVQFAKVSPYTALAVTSITAVVNAIVQIKAKRIYWKESTSYRWTTTGKPLEQRAVEKTVRTFYKDSNYATKIKSPITTTVYAKGYKK